VSCPSENILPDICSGMVTQLRSKNNRGKPFLTLEGRTFQLICAEVEMEITCRDEVFLSQLLANCITLIFSTLVLEVSV